MSNVEIWLVIIGLTLITILMRSKFPDARRLLSAAGTVQHGLRYARCVPDRTRHAERVLTQGAFNLSIANPKLVAGLAQRPSSR